ncbi:helix-turn-helix domain-containing protein [Streptomyces sp. NPDC020707]|uniref:helix-turn-helix domain-containing protein n=1 Tax=Streptomyces sp. NPDC020707 TaxID=3365084 RepID=UPI00379D7277
MSTSSAAEQRLRLRTELRKARQDAALTQRQVADLMEWSPSKLLRIESGENGISVNDLRPLLAAYGITDPPRIEMLLDLARGSKKMPYSEYRDLFPKDFLQFLALESAAQVCRYFNSLQLPRLLQTEEYARAIAAAYVGGTLSEEHERMIEAQLSRQDVLQNVPDREVFVILDEAVLHRHVGGQGVMRAQLLRIAALSEQPGVSIRILPYTVGAHAGLQGPFTLLEFRTDDMPASLFLENPRGDSFATASPQDTARYLELFWQLEELSIKDGVRELIEGLAQRLGEGLDGLAGPLPG